MCKSLEELMERGREEGRAEGKAEGKAEGRTEGLKKGRTEGLEKQKIATARLMLEDGEPIEKIIKYTGLTRDQIEKAKK